MKIQQASGSLYPNVDREEFFKMENPSVPSVIWLQDLDIGGDVEIHTAPDDVGGPGSWTLRSTVTLPAMSMKKEDLPQIADEPYIKITPLASKTGFSLASPSPFHYARHIA